MHDVIVIGGGAAGLSAALVLGRARRDVLVIDAGEPRNAPAAHMQGYLSRDGMPPSELLAIGREEIARYGVQLVPSAAVGAAEVDGGFEVEVADGRVFSARRLLFATGLRDEVPSDIVGVHERWGRDLLHCPYCHGWEVRDQPLGVIGWNAESVQHALIIRQWSDDLVYFSHGRGLDDAAAAQFAARGIRVVDGVVERLVVDQDRLTGVQLSDGSVVSRTAVFVRPVMHPNDGGLLATLGVSLDEAGFPMLGNGGAASVYGVWVAGNAGNVRAQVITAAGEGSAVAITINADLMAES